MTALEFLFLNAVELHSERKVTIAVIYTKLGLFNEFDLLVCGRNSRASHDLYTLL